MNILGISAYYHEAACCLLQHGRLVAAAAEERFTRRKHDPRLPVNALRACLHQANITIADVDAVAFYERPDVKVARQQQMGVPAPLAESFLPRTNQLIELLIRDGTGFDGPILFVDHHSAHAASAFYYSGFEDAALLTVDGVGEWTTTAYGSADSNHLTLLETVDFPHSLGLLYATLTAYLGFRVNDGEYKVMGLAAYGQPRYTKQLAQLVEGGTDGQYTLNMAFFDYVRGSRMYTDALCELLGQPARLPEEAITSFHCDVARTVQQLLETILLDKATYLARRVPSRNLCMAGGVALNCVANGRIVREGPFDHVFIQPAAGDDGGCLGAAALAHVQLTGARPAQGRVVDMCLGPSWTAAQIGRILQSAEIPAHNHTNNRDRLLDDVVARLIAGQSIGWFHGRMEFGPRALGARSILANPLLADSQTKLNRLIKRRESFRPFAPAVLAEHAANHFNLDHASPFMLETCRVQSPLSLPAITHVDGSARPQTVDAAVHPLFAALLEHFYAATGCPMLLNTSFNMRGEPIVCTPADALLCFGRSGLDALVIEGYVLDRQQIPANWQTLCELWAPVAPTRSALLSDTLYTFV